MRVAALYDIHGNLPALDAVLAEAGAVDALVVGGDITAGPLPRATLERVLALGDRAHLIRGNADRAVVEGTVERGDLADEHVQLLAGLPLTVTLDVDGLGPTVFCHATPRDDETVFTERDADDVVADLLGETAESTIVCGHTHLQIDRRVGARRVVNAGNVGFPRGAVGAHWALLGPGVDLRQTEYDSAAAYERFRATPCYAEDRGRFLVDNLLTPPPRSDALDFFEQIAVQQRGGVT